MSHRIIACVWRDGKPTQFHEFPLPEMCEPGFYRATVSYDAFRNRENRRLYEANLRGIRDLPLRTSLGHEEDNTLWQGFAYIGEPYPQTVKHVNLWAFYKAIGYDYKRKRYEV